MGMWERRDCKLSGSSFQDGELGFAGRTGAGCLQEVADGAASMGRFGCAMEAAPTAGIVAGPSSDGVEMGAGFGWHQKVNAGFENPQQQQYAVSWGRDEVMRTEAATAAADEYMGFESGFEAQNNMAEDVRGSDGNAGPGEDVSGFQSDYVPLMPDNVEAVADLDNENSELAGQYTESAAEKEESHEEPAFQEDPDEEEDSDGTPEEQHAFVKVLEQFFRDRSLEFKAPKFYGEELNCLKLWKAVNKLGGYDQVTSGKLWRQVGESFKPPRTCTTISWSFRGFYEKALLGYERFKTGVPLPSQDGGDTGDHTSRGDQDTLSPASQPPSGTGRARRDAAARAMQGWHSQRVGNGEVGEPVIKEKNSARRDKKIKGAAGLFKRKEGAGKGRANLREEMLDETQMSHGVPCFKKKTVKQEHSKSMKTSNNMATGIELVVNDEGPQADWVKINVHQTRDCFEVYALVPGLLREEVRIQCEVGGRLVIAGEPEQPDNPWGVTAFRKVINLPLRIDAHQTSAVVTLHGQLFIRVPFAQAES